MKQAMKHFAFPLLLSFLGAASAFAERPVVRVTTVEQLYGAVNNPLNAGVRVELAAGTYLLTPADPSGAARPNHGTLLLQPDMSLVGQQEYQDLDADGVWDPIPGLGPDSFVVPGTETKIEARMLTPPVLTISDCNPPPNTNLFAFTFPVIHDGRKNRVERLTVSDGAMRKILRCVGPPFHDPSLALGNGWESEIVDCILEGGNRGAVFSNVGCGTVGFISRGTFARNIVRYNGGGIFMLNFLTDNPAGEGSTLHATLRHNRFYENRNDAALGLTAGGYGADNSELHVRSIGNIFERNALAVRVTGGSNTTTPNGSNGNRCWFASRGDTIRNNSPRGGLVIHGAHRTLLTAGTSSNNHARVELTGTTFAANSLFGARRDILMMGAIGSAAIAPGPTDFFPGQNNVVEALVLGATGDGTPGTFLVVDSSAEEPSNRVVIRGSSTAFERMNEALDSPGDEFFSQDSK
jgi:hypothetical protein